MDSGRGLTRQRSSNFPLCVRKELLVRGTRGTLAITTGAKCRSLPKERDTGCCCIRKRTRVRRGAIPRAERAGLFLFGKTVRFMYSSCLSPSFLYPKREETVIIGDRLRDLRESKKLSQGDIEKRTGLLRCYISRVENGHTVPAIETLEKLARALEIPLYQLFYEGEEPPKLPAALKRKTPEEMAWGSSGKQAAYLQKLRRCLSKAAEEDRKLILAMAQKVAGGRGRRTSAET